MTKTLLTGCVVCGLAAAPAFAGQQPTTAEKADKTMAYAKDSDATFVMKVAHGGMAEVDLGKLAVEKAGSDEVKKFGQRMVDDHSKANDELKILAQNKHITLPAQIDPQEKALHDRLAKLSGPSFDRAYMQAMIADHRQDLDEFRMESKSGKDADVKGWAAKTLPMIEAHVKLAQNASRAVSPSGTTGSKK
jgi:putative membrane protein